MKRSLNFLKELLDLIVMGTHGERVLTGYFRQYCDSVLRNSKCPVMLACASRINYLYRKIMNNIRNML
jgi:hypothetical protein